ncbi:MAG: hypothetical protein ABL907_18895 [Hyphomicrobium sp.]
MFFFVFIAALIVVGGLLLRGYLATGSVTGSITNTFFAPRPQKRLEVMDHANVDGRRRLVLVRRDNVEHLIMIGGPVDVVVETGIGESRGTAKPSAEVVEPPVFSRPPRSLGQAVTDKLAVAEKQAVGEK